jgi:hypothetical protein
VKVVGLNFSSATTPELLLKTLDHYCEYRKTPNGMVLSPVQVSPPDLEDPEYNNSWSLFSSRYILYRVILYRTCSVIMQPSLKITVSYPDPELYAKSGRIWKNFFRFYTIEKISSVRTVP